jgi:hypothetical protein
VHLPVTLCFDRFRLLTGVCLTALCRQNSLTSSNFLLCSFLRYCVFTRPCRLLRQAPAALTALLILTQRQTHFCTTSIFCHKTLCCICTSAICILFIAGTLATEPKPQSTYKPLPAPCNESRHLSNMETDLPSPRKMGYHMEMGTSTSASSISTCCLALYAR